MKLNYFTQEEIKTLSKRELFLQATLGLQSCKTKKDVYNIFEDIDTIAKAEERKWILFRMRKLDQSIKSNYVSAMIPNRSSLWEQLKEELRLK